MKDYSNHLISISWHYLSPEECQDRAMRDINPDFRFCDMRAEAGDGYYFEPAKDSFAALCGEHNLLEALQVDLLRPQFDYLSLKYNSLLYLLLDAKHILLTSLERRGIEPEWSMIYTNTEDDSPVSAFRRTLIYPNCGFDGCAIDQKPRPSDLSVDLIAGIEDDFEDHFRSNMAKEHYS